MRDEGKMFFKEGRYKKVISYLPFFSLFALSFIISLLIQNLIKLPFSNPWKVTGPLTLINYNPVNNIVKFLFVVIFPSFVLYLTNKFTRFLGHQKVEFTSGNRDAGGSKLSSTSILLLILAVLFLIVGKIPDWYKAANSLVDTFHEGETLGPAIDYLNSKIPYRDTIFVHGAFQDPLRSVLAFNLFGKSIGAVRTLSVLLEMLAIIFFILSLYFIFYKDIVFTTLAVIILSPFFLLAPSLEIGFTIPHRDICLFLYLILVAKLIWSLNRHPSYCFEKTDYLLLFMIHLVPAISFAYSVDRGFYITAVTFNIWLLCFLHFRLRDTKFWLSAIGGYLVGILGLGLVIRWAYIDFFQFIFLTMPRYKELMDGFVYQFKIGYFIIPVILIAFNIYWLTYRFIQYIYLSEKGSSRRERIKYFYTEYFMEIFLCILSIFYFRSALGRTDIPHVLYSSSLIYILFIYIITKYYFCFHIKKFKKFVFLSLIIVSLSTIFGVQQKYTMSKKDFFLPVNISDEEFIPVNYKATILFFRENLKDEEEFFTMTSEAIWYYFLDRPCPTRFQVVWFASPYFYQRGIIDALDKRKVKYILYRNSHWANVIDGIENERRLPIVIDYIKSKYIFYRKIDDNEIWVLKEKL
jgi:hypothetical protein